MGKHKNTKSAWRKMTPDESARCADAISKELKRLNESVKAGGGLMVVETILHSTIGR